MRCWLRPTPWKPSVRALFKGGKTLVQSARLRDSFQGDSDEHRAAVGSNLISVGPEDIKQMGATTVQDVRQTHTVQ